MFRAASILRESVYWSPLAFSENSCYLAGVVLDMGTLLIFPRNCVYSHERQSFQRPENNHKIGLSLSSSFLPLLHFITPFPHALFPFTDLLSQLCHFAHTTVDDRPCPHTCPHHFCHKAPALDNSVNSRPKLNSSQLQARDLPQGRTPFNSCFPKM